MGAVKICVYPRAKVPYYVETTGVRLYSMEELAYYLYENIYLIDEQIVGEPLYAWMEKELKMSKLAEKLRGGNGSDTHVYNKVMVILTASEYYSEEELAELSAKITAISGLQTQERMKYKADDLLQNGNYWAAINEYERILTIRQNSRLNVEFYAKIWNNLAVCYSKLYLFEKAMTCFENAYQFQKIPEYKEKTFYLKMLTLYGKNSLDEALEPLVTEELLGKAKIIFKELEVKNHQYCETVDAEEIFQEFEKKYLRNSRL